MKALTGSHNALLQAQRTSSQFVNKEWKLEVTLVRELVWRTTLHTLLL